MKYKVECTHIISHLLNIKKYTTKDIHQEGDKWYIEVFNKMEYLYIKEMDLNMSRALWWYKNLIEETSK